jgi:hypothetical protein
VKTTGAFNTATGVSAMYNSMTGDSNTVIGFDALEGNTTGSNNTALGVGAGINVRTANNVICIGWHVPGDDVSNTCWMGNIYGVTTQSATTLPVIVSANGQLGTTASSARFKKDIKPMERNSEAILAFKPVTFHYKSDTTNTPQFGLVAEDVAKVNPELVVRDKEGKPYSERYDQVNAMLLNEFLKEHGKVEQLTKDFESKFAEQQKQIEALSAGLQKVTADVETSRPAPQMVGR